MDLLKPAQTRLAVPFVLLLLIFLSGCAGRVVKPGDTADVDFLCRLKTGEVVAATEKSVQTRADLPKSRVFLEVVKDGPIALQATDAALKLHEAKETPFEDEIMNRLAPEIVGMRPGEDRTFTLTADDVPGRDEAGYVVKIAHVRRRPKEMKMSPADYKARTGKEPEEGQTFPADPAITGRVESVSKDEVVVKFSAKDGAIDPTPFGPGRIRETQDNYEIVINAKEGDLVRTGGLVGRIAGVDEEYITIDYRNPFGGKELTCDVGVKRIEDKKPAQAGMGKPRG